MQHQLLKSRLKSLWKTTSNYILIDLGYDFYIAKLPTKDQLNHVLERRPCFVNSHFLSVQKWVPNFIANKETITNTTIWIHLPTEFYDGVIFKKMGNVIGKLLKIDVCTYTTTSGYYARLCVEVSLTKPLKSSIQINNHSQ
ncbi:hypothetical protein H5410_016681 [Solanum commersonii]|uniref:DUF4283 domain-containing protein n=1 Tax=Solanum commersonii TaxID=4109 RepID=A0A9J5ZX56_SOLCO|nr:hypothetical protein H5410_016681 [Solanum commersonii]